MTTPIYGNGKTREVTDEARADLIASTVDVVTGRAIVIDDALGVIEVADPRWQIITWRGNHAADTAAGAAGGRTE